MIDWGFMSRNQFTRAGGRLVWVKPKLEPDWQLIGRTSGESARALAQVANSDAVTVGAMSVNAMTVDAMSVNALTDCERFDCERMKLNA